MKGIPGHKAKVRSLDNCAKLIAFLEENGETGTSTIKENTGLTTLHTSHLFTFNDLLRRQGKTFRLTTRAVGSSGELHWSLKQR